MVTKLGKPVTRHLDVGLRGDRRFAVGFLARMTPEGVWLKPPRCAWKNAYLATWGDVLLVGAARRAAEIKAARRARRQARRTGVTT